MKIIIERIIFFVNLRLLKRILLLIPKVTAPLLSKIIGNIPFMQTFVLTNLILRCLEKFI